MPFGKHKGQSLDTVDDAYLEWLQTIELRPWLREAVEEEVTRRRNERERERWYQEAAHRQAREQAEREAKEARDRDARKAQDDAFRRRGRNPVGHRPTALTIIKRGFKALSLELHPDHGGEHTEMIRLIETKDWLLQVVQRQLTE